MSREWTRKISFISIIVIISMLGALLLPDLQMAYAAEKNNNKKVELTELRTEYSKTYKQGKRKYILEEYLEPIHFNDRGVWRPIDNEVESVSKKNALDEELSYENKANRYRVGFAKNSRANKLVRFQLGQARVDFGLPKDADSVQASVKENRVSYNNVYPDTHLVYYADNTGIKEEWVLDQYNGQSVFTLTMKTKGVKAKIQKDGSIDFVDEQGDVPFTIPRPFMVDENLDSSDDVRYEIREEGNTTYLDLKADEEWLKDDEREYPVRIDPSLVIQGTYNVYDSFVGDAQPNTNFGGYTYLTIGNNPTHGRSRTYIKFELEPLLSGAKILSSTLSLYQVLNGNTERINLHPVTQSWRESTITWNNQPSVGAAIANQSVSGPGWYDWDLTDLTKEWYSGKTANYGTSLRMAPETNDRKSWRSAGYAADPTQKPKLTIVYEIDPIGQESFWTSVVSNVNTYNGNFHLQESDVSISGRGVPASVERFYNSRSSGNGIFGNKWTSNLEQKLTDSGDGPILYTDADGTPHTFTPNGDGTYQAPGGIHLELEKKGDGTYIMTEKDQMESHFNTSGRLTKMVDSHGNTTTITYTSSRPTKITDASGREVTLTYNAANRVSQVTDPVNRAVAYTYDGDGNLKTVTNKDSSGQTLSTVTYGYDGSQRITSITDPNGNETTVTYNADNRVTSISHPITVNGKVETATTQLSYDITNNLTTVTNPKGKKTLYTHNAYGNVIQVTQDAGGLNYKDTFVYNDKNELISEKDANANASNSDAAYHYQYDENGNLISVTNPLNETSTTEYDDNNNPIAETDPEGNTTTHEYDDENNPTSSTDPVEKSSAQKYNSHGNLIEDTTQMSPGNNLARNGSFEIHRNSSTWPDDWRQTSGSKSIVWANSGLTVEGITLGERSMRIVNPTNDTILASSHFIPYDSNKTYFGSGYVQIQNAKGIAGIQVTGYDASGNITKRIKSNEISGTQGPVRLHAAVEPGAFPANTTRFRIRAYIFGKNGQYDGTYTFDGLQIEEGFFGAYNIVENGDFERNDDPVDDIPDRWYLAGNIEGPDGLDATEQHVGELSVKLVGHTEKWKTVRQDIKLSGDAGSILTVSGFSKVENPRPSGVYGYIIETYQGSTRQETFTHNFDRTKSHDWQHRTAQLKTTKPFDNIKVFYEYSLQTGTAWFDTAKVIIGPVQTRYQYDTNGNYQTKSTDPVGKSVENTYDTVGNTTSEKKGADTTSFAYDGADRLTKVTDANGNETRYAYDANGNKTKIVNARNKETTFEYNEINEIKKMTDALNQSTQFDYDINGNQTKVTYPNGNTVESDYDAVDRLTSISHNETQRYSFEYDPNGNVTKEMDHAQNKSSSYTYDEDNKLKAVTEPENNKTEYTYDKNGNVTEQKYTAGSSVITHGMIYNELDQLTRINENGTKRADYTYDENDRVASRKNQDGTVSLYQYNGAGDLVEQVILDGNGEEMDRFTYTYDNKGNITTIQSTDGTTQYEYDQLEQLTKEIRPDGTVIEYTYDAVGNRLTKKVTKDGNTTTTNYTYDDADQLTAVDGTNYTHDKNGNLTSDGQWTYVYDAGNRLIEVKEGGNTVASFTYRADGMRKTITTADGTITFHYDEQKNVTYETNENNQVVASYTYGSNNELVSMTRGGKTYYYQTNYRGDVTALTDSTGAVVATYEYDAFGSLIGDTGNVENPYRYAGYRYDEVTGLYYLQSRYYNPDTGRFLTRDSFKGFENQPLSKNRYSYTENNPVNYTDPDGYWKKSIYLSNRTAHFLSYLAPVVLGALVKRYLGFFVGAVFSAILHSYLVRRIGKKGTIITLWIYRVRARTYSRVTGWRTRTYVTFGFSVKKWT